MGYLIVDFLGHSMENLIWVYDADACSDQRVVLEFYLKYYNLIYMAYILLCTYLATHLWGISTGFVIFYDIPFP